jgi:hypothetical protein
MHRFDVLVFPFLDRIGKKACLLVGAGDVTVFFGKELQGLLAGFGFGGGVGH